jgi:tetratricopeptide (TPR) repeat protein
MASAAELKAQGLALFRADRLDEAAQRFSEAARAFAAAGDRGGEAEMLNNLCVVRLAQKDWAAAIAAVEPTPAVFHALGDSLRATQAIANLAAAHDGAGHVEQAAALYEQAVELFGELGETENRAACFKALSALQVKQGKQLQALASMHSGLNLSPRLSGREKTLKGLLDKAMKMIGK